MTPDIRRVSGDRPFFVPGGTLPNDAPSYITRQADFDLLEGLHAGQFCYVLTSRQMGKSSLMVRIAGQLRGESVAVAILDLTALGQNLSVEQWYFGLLEQLGRHLKLDDALEDYWQAHKALGPLQRWMAAIRDVVLRHTEGQVTLFVDEIDIVRSLPFSTDEFFAAIRECYNRRALEPDYERLTFCLLGVATPGDLIRDTAMTPFNIGRRIELTDFTPKEAEALSVGISVTGRDGHGLLHRILYWSGGHPYLTQRLCVSVAEEPTAVRDEDVDRLCANLFLARRASESDDNLQFVRNRIVKSHVDLTALLGLYSRVRRNARVPDDMASVLTSVLKLSGIVRVEHGELKVRNRIYARVFDSAWLSAHLPGAEIRRQRAAYRQGLVRALALSGTVLVALSGLTIFGFLQADRANRNERLARRATSEARRQADSAERISYIARMNLVQRDWEIGDFDDVVDLLANTRKSRFQGFEWGYWNRLLHFDLLALKGHSAPVNAVAYSPDGKRIVTGSRDKTARVWDAATGRETLLPRGHTGQVVATAYSPNGKQIVTLSQDLTARLWDAATGQQTRIFKGSTSDITSVAFSPDGREIVAGYWDGTAKVRDAATGRERLTLRGDPNRIVHVAFSPDGKQIATLGLREDTVKIWDAATGQEKRTLRGHRQGIFCLAFSPDGRQIVTGSEDDTAKVWDAATGQETLTFRGVRRLCRLRRLLSQRQTDPHRMLRRQGQDLGFGRGRFSG